MALFTKGRGRERMEQEIERIERVEIGYRGCSGVVGWCGVGWGGVGNKADPKLPNTLGWATQKCIHFWAVGQPRKCIHFWFALHKFSPRNL